MTQATQPARIEDVLSEATAECWAFAFRLVGDREAAEDAVQDAYLRVLRSRSVKRRIVSGERGLLFRVVYSCSVDELRRRKRRGRLLAELQSVPPRAVIGNDGRSGALTAALAALDVDERAAVLLVDVHGLSYAEAADALRVQRGTLASRLHHARARLRAALKQQLAEVP